jgi:peptidyl-prolyl cis-trans isomerase SurA
MTRLALPVLLSWLLLAPPLAAQDRVPLDRIAVVVNDEVILDSEVQRAIGQAEQQIRARGVTVPPGVNLRGQVIERLVLQRVQTQRARQAGIRIDDRELNEVLTGIAQQNQMTLAQFADALRSEGTDYVSVREQVREEMLINRIRSREVDARVLVTDQDIEQFLSFQNSDASDVEYRLAHILSSFPDGASPDQRRAARAKIDALRERIVAGEDFSAIAIAESDGQQALQGGDLGFRNADALPQVFATAAAKLDLGGLSPVLETTSGYHLIRLIEQRGGSPRQSVEETRARHLLIQPNTLRNDEQSRQLVRDLHARIEKGESIADLASEYSDDPGSKNSGGDLGFQPPGVFVPEFQARMDQLAPGEISAPFRSQFGWHILEVLERRTRDVTEETRRARARGAVQQRRAAEEYDTWLRRLRAEAYIEYRIDGDDPDAGGRAG